MSRRKEKFADKPKKEYDEVMLEVRRVTRVTTWGRQLSFRAIILVGNRKGKIGIGISKGADVQIAVAKATHDAYKHVIDAPVSEAGTVPYQVTRKYKWAVVKLIPAAAGTGLKAGSSVRMVLELAGYTNMLSKIVGSSNKLNNALATVNALAGYKEGKFPERVKKPVVKEEVTPEKATVAAAEVTDEISKAPTSEQIVQAPQTKASEAPSVPEKAAPAKKPASSKKPAIKKTTKTTEKKPAPKKKAK